MAQGQLGLYGPALAGESSCGDGVPAMGEREWVGRGGCGTLGSGSGGCARGRGRGRVGGAAQEEEGGDTRRMLPVHKRLHSSSRALIVPEALPRSSGPGSRLLSGRSPWRGTGRGSLGWLRVIS